MNSMPSGKDVDPHYGAVVLGRDPIHESQGSYAYATSERDALNGSGTRSKTNPFLVALFVFIISCLLFESSAHIFNQCPLSYSQRATAREGWNQEALAQLRLRHEWQRERQDQENLHLEWALEGKHHQEELDRRHERERAYEDEVRKDWQREMQTHLEHQEEQRRQWDVEAENHNREMERRRREWQDEVAKHDRLEKERRQREKQERQKMNMFWGQVEAHHCTTYATREYTAVLKNIPVNYPYRVEACKETPLEVHGISYLPRDCEIKGPGFVIGRWEVKQNEPDCMTYWNWYKDKGCTSVKSGKRRIEHYLENLPQGGDWREFCAKTPATFLGMHFSGAQICFQYNLGTYGHWEIDDSSC